MRGSNLKGRQRMRGCPPAGMLVGSRYQRRREQQPAQPWEQTGPADACPARPARAAHADACLQGCRHAAPRARPATHPRRRGWTGRRQSAPPTPASAPPARRPRRQPTPGLRPAGTTPWLPRSQSARRPAAAGRGAGCSHQQTASRKLAAQCRLGAPLEPSIHMQHQCRLPACPRAFMPWLGTQTLQDSLPARLPA